MRNIVLMPYIVFMLELQDHQLPILLSVMIFILFFKTVDYFVFRWRFQQVKEKCRHWCSTICGARKPKWMWTGFPY